MSLSLQNISVATPDGEFNILIDDESVAYASGFADVTELEKRLPSWVQPATISHLSTHPYQLLVEQYYDGDTEALDKIHYLQAGTDFQKKVWNAIKSIPYGKTISYKELARQSGNEAAIRAAGTICGLNRLILIVPCHRVLKSDGGIGSYLYGSAIKESLLKHELAIA